MKICNSCMQITADSAAECTICNKKDFTPLTGLNSKRKNRKKLGSKLQAGRIQNNIEPQGNYRSPKKTWYNINLSLIRSFLAGFLVLTIVASNTIYATSENPLNLQNWIAKNSWIESVLRNSMESAATFLGVQQPQRLLPTVDFNSNGQFNFFLYDAEGYPTGFHSPCEPIRYEINPTNEPVGAREILDAAIQAMRFYTGLEFEFVGETDEIAELTEEPSPVNPSSTLLINYFPTEEFMSLPKSDDYQNVEDAIGWGGPRSYESLNSYKGQYRALGGVMVMDSDIISSDIAGGLWGYSPGHVTFTTMIHELGHVLGLDHVDSKTEIMHFGSFTSSEFQDGDQEGLSIAGQGACGVDALGNLVFGKEPAGIRNAEIPDSCVIEELRDTHTMFESREESSVDNLTCAITPFLNETADESLTVDFRFTKLSANSFFDIRLSEFNQEGLSSFRAKRDFEGTNCELQAVLTDNTEYNFYWLDVICSGRVAQVRGYGFDVDRYFESPTLTSIIRHMQSN